MIANLERCSYVGCPTHLWSGSLVFTSFFPAQSSHLLLLWFFSCLYLVFFSGQNNEEAIGPRKQTEFTGCFRDLKKWRILKLYANMWTLFILIKHHCIFIYIYIVLSLPVTMVRIFFTVFLCGMAEKALGFWGGNEVLNITQPRTFPHQILRAA